MNKKKLLISFLWIALITLGVFLFLRFYVVPSLEGINHLKRELNDMNSNIEDLQRIQKSFPFIDAKESTFLKSAEATLKKRIPVVRNKDDLNSLLASVLDYIKKRARSDSINNLKMTDNRGQIDISKGTRIRVYLSFSGTLKSVMNFIEHLPREDYYVMPGNITFVPGRNSVNCSIVLKVYTIDVRGEISELEDQEIIIDLQSPVLFQRVYENSGEVYTGGKH